MRNAMADQGTGPCEGPGVGKEWIGLAADRPHDGGIEIDEVGMVAGEMRLVIDAMGIVTDSTGRPPASLQMPAMTTPTAGRALLERGVQQDIVPIMTPITQGIGGKIFRGPNDHLVALPQNRTVLRAMGAIGPRPTDLGAQVTVMAISAIDDRAGGE